MLLQQCVKNDLILIKTNFLQIVTTIKRLKKSNTLSVGMTNIIQNTFTQLMQIPRVKAEVVKTNYCNLNQKSNDKNIEQVFSGNNTSCLKTILPTIN